jgi:putative peptide zinc metalloprotease protein
METRSVVGPDEGGLQTQLVSSHWYRAASIAPRLRQQLRIHPQRYRGQLWFVIEDRVNGRYHRFERRAWRIIRLLDGSLTLEQLWQRLTAEGGPDTPSQEDVLALLGQLHALDLLASGSLPDLAEAARRERRQARLRWWQRYFNPLALRIRLVDPDRFLCRAVRALKPILNGFGALLWLAWVVPAFVLAISHWPELSSNFTERMLAFGNLALLWLIFPVVKALHETGHGIACRMRGGEVHEMGIMLLLFLPVPYVDASSAWTFGARRDRVLVGAAGMLVELAIAAGAFYLWLWLQPGTVKAIAFDTAVLASVTTVIFNANPLLRYDGYYIASDLLEIPNLGQRAARYWGYLIERWILRHREPASPVMAPGEALWFGLYAPLSLIYRLLVLSSIGLFISTRYFAFGVLIALWSIGAALGVPLYRGLKGLKRMLADERTGTGGKLALVGALAAIVAFLFVVPLPYDTQVEGIVWLPQSGVLRAQSSGFVRQVLLRSGTSVPGGADVMQLADPSLAADLAEQSARVEAADARYQAGMVANPALGEQLASQLKWEQAQLTALKERAARLEVHTAAPGRLWIEDARDLPGRYVKRGEVVGYVIPPSAPRVRVIVNQADDHLIRARTLRIGVKLPFDPAQTWSARIVRAVPQASNELPSAALGREGGGAVVTDPRDTTGRKALTSHFEYELALPRAFPYHFIGSRASVRFKHPPEPIGYRMIQGLRRLFLAYFRT